MKELSLNRANAVREALVNKYKMDPNRFAAGGHGLGRAGRSERSGKPGQESPRGNQSLLGRETVIAGSE